MVALFGRRTQVFLLRTPTVIFVCAKRSSLYYLCEWKSAMHTVSFCGLMSVAPRPRMIPWRGSLRDLAKTCDEEIWHVHYSSWETVRSLVQDHF